MKHYNGSFYGIGWDKPDENDTLFEYVLHGGAYDGVDNGFSQLQIGWRMNGIGTMPDEFLDLSMYDSFTLSFHPLSVVEGDRVLVNLWMNTGWTDDPWNENDVYYENTWTWVDVCEDPVLHLDFDELGIQNLHHVSGLGFNLGANDPDSLDSDQIWGASFGGEISMDTVPEPVTAIFFATGVVGVFGLFTRRRMHRE